MTRKPSRLRRWLKWVGLAASIVLVVAWLVSLQWGVAYHARTWGLGIDRGEIAFAIDGVGRAFTTSIEMGRALGRRGVQSQWNSAVGRWESVPCWELYEPAAHSWNVAASIGPRGVTVFVAFWIPLALVGVPTAFLWYRDRRPPPGRCQQCGYDLTGNVSGVCPECGATIERSSSREEPSPSSKDACRS